MYNVDKEMNVCIDGHYSTVELPESVDEVIHVSVHTFGYQAYVLARYKDRLLLLEYKMSSGGFGGIPTSITTIPGEYLRATFYVHDYKPRVSTFSYIEELELFTLQNNGELTCESCGLFDVEVLQMTYLAERGELVLSIYDGKNLTLSPIKLS